MFRSTHKTFLTLVAILCLLMSTTSNASAWVATDQEDYTPGSIVTISGGNDETGAPGYVAGATVNVAIIGPHDPAYESTTCETVIAGEGGAWSCTVTLWSDPEWAEGTYTYTATSVNSYGSPIEETGTFTDWVGGVLITSPTLISPVTVNALPGSVPVVFTYYTSSSGTTTATACVGKVLDEDFPNAQWMWCSPATIITSGGNVLYPLSATINVPITSPASNDLYSVKVTVNNTYGSWFTIKSWTAYSLAAVEIDVPACTGPSVTDDPDSATKAVGDSVTFSVMTDGTIPLSYQWRKGSVNIGGATSSSYTIPSVIVADAGSYDVVVSNACGSVTSSVATLTVNNATPIISAWPTASGITYGQNLSASILTGGTASVPGSFAFAAPSTAPNAGTYSAAVTFAPTDLTNYNTVDGSVNVALAKAALTVTASSPAAGKYGDPVPTITVGYSGFVLGDDAGDLDTAPTCSTTYTQSSAPGDYPTSCSGGADGNYDFSYVAGNFHVDKAFTTTALKISPANALLNQPVTFTATVSPVAPATGTPGGNVSFYDGTALLATKDLVNGQAELTTSNLALGSHSITAVYSGDTNWEGSTSTVISVKVTYQFIGFSQPVDNNGVLNSAKAGQAIPLKFRLVDYNGVPVTNLASVTVTVTNLSCSAATTTDSVEEYASGSSGLQNLGDGYYQWNWKTPTAYANLCKTLKLDLGEGAGNEHTALFQFKK